MKTPVKLGGYVAGLAAVFVAAWGAGTTVGPSPAPAVEASVHSGHTNETKPSAEVLPGGLQVSQDGYRLAPVSREMSSTAANEFSFQVLGPDGQPVTRYTPTHEKDLHLIVVRRDMSGFQHVHPTMRADGTWSIPLRVSAPGQYRVFADFQPAERDKGLTLGVDVPAGGTYQPAPLPTPVRTTTVDGYTVTLAGDLVPGTDSKLTLTVGKDGKPVTDLQPYLGSYGHLVALREGDLAYLHVHPDGAPGDGRTAAGPEITFSADVPSTGAYRLYLDFQHGGAVHTAEFTALAGDAAANPAPTLAPLSPASPSAVTGEHGEPGHGHN